MPRKKKIKQKFGFVVGHRHTGKLLHNQHTSYATLVMVLLLTGLLLITFNITTNAANLSVSAEISGSAPTQPAKITSPSNGQSFNRSPINIEGTCQASTIIKLYRNNTLAGATLCDNNGFFSVQVAILQGNNRLIAKTLNSANVAGPDSQPVTVLYDSTNPVTEQPIINTEYMFEGFTPGQKITWKLGITGGTAPYGLSVDWGDGTTEVHSILQDGPYELHHSYKDAGDFMGSYTITIKVSDALGNSSFMQLLAIVNDPSSTNIGIFSPLSKGEGGLSKVLTSSSIAIAWPLLIFASLLLLSFWLGERREHYLLTKRMTQFKS